METPKQALNKAYLKQPVIREDIDHFKKAFYDLKEKISIESNEDHNKKWISDFLENTHFPTNTFAINNKSKDKNRSDLVIHLEKNTHSPVGVIIEAKRPTNKTEMITQNNLNQKALQELLLYYLEERIAEKNIQLKQLAVTNAYEWFLFDAQEFEKHFVQNKNLIKAYEQFKRKELTGTTTDFFYSEIAKPYIEQVKHELEYTYFNIFQYDTTTPDEEWIALYKLLSPEHLLKRPFLNDSNSLDKNFYNELLYIIGLQELPQGGKDIIHRYDAKRRHAATLIEQAIDALPNTITDETIQFETAMELCITWINRILFIKLLEGQLVSYHKDKETFSLLQKEKIKDFHALDDFFFKVLAIPTKDRNTNIATRWKHIPYLNSSLFDATDIERQYNLFIKNLNTNSEIPVFDKTVLKDPQGKPRQKENIPILEYLFLFLDAYNFSSEGTATIQTDRKTLINASVLGLVFEKINGYKDGSFFTPGAITMYMCKETITQAVIEKFNHAQSWQCTSLNELFNKNLDIKEANNIINSIKICDPAVGSGHFLVSALNQLIAIKSELQILVDDTGKRIKETIRIENDELIITDYEDTPFQYHPKDPNSNRIQKTLFNEKQRLIENCLFGVDINPNSVKICRLRLWIELLKNAYYKTNGELETLPNIDINIKCGNSLISRFDMDTDISELLKNSKWNIHTYRTAVDNYKNTTHKQEKKELLQMIDDIKADFSTALHTKHPLKITLKNLQGKLFSLTQQTQLYQRSKKEQADYDKQLQKLSENIDLVEQQITTIETGEIYKNAFEWRFEFPEVLDEQGNFTGFDVVIGNPPYIDYREIEKRQVENMKHFKTLENSSRPNLYQFFIEKGYYLLKDKGDFCFINPNHFLSIDSGYGIRKFLIENTIIRYIDNLSNIKVFDKAATYTIVWSFKKEKDGNYPVRISKCFDITDIGKETLMVRKNDIIANGKYLIIANVHQVIIHKIEKDKQKLGSFCNMIWGTSQSGYGKKKIKQQQYNLLKPKEQKNYEPIIQTRDIKKYQIVWTGEYIPHGGFSTNAIEKFKISPKIVIARMTLSLQAAIDTDKYYVGKSTVLFDIDKAFNMLFVLGLLNSRLINFWYANYFENTHLSGGYMRFDIPYLQKIPIPKATAKEQTPIIKLVDKILATKKKNPTADTTALEQEIDQLVYGLYNLTKEEIQVVEGKK